METNDLQHKLNQKLTEFEALEYETSSHWNEEFMTKLADSKVSKPYISASKITVLMLAFAIINVGFFVTVINTNSKEVNTSDVRKNELQNIRYELLSNVSCVECTAPLECKVFNKFALQIY